MSTAAPGFVWYELMTTDVPSATAFYAEVVGWRIADAGMPGMAYSYLHAGERAVGGLMALPAEAAAAGARPGWVGYIGVADVDAQAQQVVQAGGRLRMGPQDIPGVGRFAALTDPHGAAFMLFKGNLSEAPPPLAAGTPGGIGWHELHAGNGVEALAFYSGQFGWTPDTTMDMGPMGVYQLFSAGAAPIGGIMTKDAAIPAPFWLYYFNVPAIDAAVGRVTGGGGKVLNGPMEVPGGDWIVQCQDPQGAMFALVAPKR